MCKTIFIKQIIFAIKKHHQNRLIIKDVAERTYKKITDEPPNLKKLIKNKNKL